MYDTIIIGAGIAGLTAAIYAARKRMKFEIISKEFGGQFNVSGEVENYPGIIKTTGPEFSEIMKKQIEFNKINIIKQEVTQVLNKKNFFRVITNKKEYDSKTVIISTGSEARKLNVPGEEKFARKGITYCSICDGPLFSGMDVAIIGGGDSALEAVDFMKDIAKKIYVINIGDEFTGHKYLIEKVKINPKVECLFNAETTEILGKKLVDGIKYKHKGKEKKLNVQGVIIEIGRVPNTKIFKDLVELNQHGHILVDCRMNTSLPGIFAAGDCASGHEYQYVISAGQGCMALIKAAKYIAKH
jgi:thioredoxin-disulfide reductase